MAKIVIAELDIDINALLKSTSDLKKEIDALKNTQKELAVSGQGASEAFVENEAVLKTLNATYNKNIKIVQESGQATKTQADQSELLSLALNQEATSIAEAREQNKLLNKLRNEANLTTAEGREELTKLNAKLDQNNAFIKENADAYLKQKINVGNYKESIKEAFSEMNIFNGGLGGFIERSQEAGGVSNLLSNSFGTIKQSIIGMTKAALTFIATPIGAVIAGIVAIGAGVKQIFDFNKGLIQTNKELKALGVNAKELSAVRDEISATAQTFDKDFKDIAIKANSLAKAYGISMSEANDIIAQGLASGGAQNSEFLDSLGEYDVFFANAGFSAQEFANIINTGYDLGIYSDKLPDALKEADLALKEQTKATRDALVNAFGATFSDEILSKVSSGQLTTKQAIDEITKVSQTANLSQQQYAQLTADVFKGAGEDVGGAQKIFEALGKSATKELDASAKASLNLAEANERLNKAQSELFEIKDFGDIWTSIKAVSIDAISAMLEYLADVKKDLQPLIDLVGILFVGAWQSLKFSFATVFDTITGIVKSFTAYFGGIINFWKKALTGDFKGAFTALADGIENSFKQIGNIFVNLYNNVVKLVSGIADVASPILETLGIDVDVLKKRIEGLKASTFEIKGEIKTKSTEISNEVKTYRSGGGFATTDAKKPDKSKQNAIDEAIKQQEAELKLLQEKNRFEEDAVKKQEILAAKEIEILNVKLKNKKISQTQYDADRLAIENNLAEVEKQKQKNDLENQKAFEQKKKDLQNQIDIQNAASDAEKNALKLSQDLEKHLAELEFINATETEKAELKKLILEQYNNDVAKLTEDAAIKQLEKQRDYNVKEIEYQKQKQDLVIGLAQQLGNTLLGILGNSLAGQLAAIAFDAIIQIAKLKIATSSAQQINLANATAMGAPPFNLPFIAAATAQNAALGASSKLQQSGILASAAISGIGAIAKKFEQGGIQEVGGKRHSAGGTKFYGEDGTMFEAEAGEGIGVLNRRAFASFMDFNNSFNGGSSRGGFFQGGGIITQGVKPQSIDLNVITDAIASMPAPIVAVEEIQTVGNRYVNVKANADF